MNKPEDNLNPENLDQPEIVEVGESNNEDVSESKVEIEEPVKEEISVEEKLKAENEEWNNKYLRLYAEFDNFKRRSQKERAELLKTAGKDVIVELLPVLDDFERALKSMETASDISAVKEGINLIYQKLHNSLSQKGLKEMDTKGQPFDADVHEAITSIPAPSDDLKGKIVDELEKGYCLNDKVIRFAKVIVGA